MLQADSLKRHDEEGERTYKGMSRKVDDGLVPLSSISFLLPSTSGRLDSHSSAGICDKQFRRRDRLQ
jgi:hypothetical protein